MTNHRTTKPYLFIVGFLLLVIFGLAYSNYIARKAHNHSIDVSSRTDTLEVRSQKVLKIIDYRYKSIDSEFERKIKIYYIIQGTNIIKFCYNVTPIEVYEYYKNKGVEITPFGKMLLRENHDCPPNILKQIK